MPIPIVLRTKILPPRTGLRTLPRPRVTTALLDSLSYRLTLLQAGAGYGKSTALAALSEELATPIWYQVTEEDADPLVFLLHLVHATQEAIPHVQGLPVEFLEGWDGSRGPLPSNRVVDQYINSLNECLREPSLVVFDDVHLAAHAAEIAFILDRLIGLAPQKLHILLSARPPLTLPNLSRWRARGDILSLDQSILAFTAGEISDLFSKQYDYDLTPGEVQEVLAYTEGWAIALQLLWQSLRSGPTTSIIEALSRPVNSLEGLFEILTKEILAGQPEDVQEFMLLSATLREMTPEACEALYRANQGSSDSHTLGSAASMMAFLRRQELFVSDVGEEGMRYHKIFHRFLQQQSPEERRKEWHRRAALYYQENTRLDEAIYHLLRAKDHHAAAALLDDYGAYLLSEGRLDTLASHLHSIPPDILHLHPPLLAHLGDLARLHSRFQEALGWYQQAESFWRERGQMEGVARAWRGQARVYLDTVNPSKAEELLQQALRLSDGIEGREARARLYELLAENKLNAGHAEEAEALRQQADSLRSEGPSDSQLWFRVLLRTGRLDEARSALEARAEEERREPVSTPRAHRETFLVLSLIYAFQGESELALRTAEEGTRRGIALESPFITAVGHARQGHALSLRGGDENYENARNQFQQTIDISERLAVPRLLVETYWGLVRVYGYQGDLQEATRLAREGIEIANQAGDEWIASLARLTLGASYAIAQRYEAAEDWLERAAAGFRECSDPFGRSAARLWQCFGWNQQKRASLLAQALPEVLATCQQHNYDFLFLKPSLLGPPDERMLTPLLVLARDQNWEREYASRLLARLGLPDIERHPGYRLTITTLGSFQVYRGSTTIPPNGWRREKARQLFQLLLTNRNKTLDREQVCEHLWPDSEPASAQRNFKVTLNTLYQVMEPNREAGSESAYIIREGSYYRLRPGADLWLDTQAFVEKVAEAEQWRKTDIQRALRCLEEAVALYQGEYLPDMRYETWAAAERENLAVQFLRAADTLADLYLRDSQYSNAVHICHKVLSHDNCWERAYRQLMLAFHHLGDRGQVARTFQRCQATLRAELDVEPDSETIALFHQLTMDS